MNAWQVAGLGCVPWERVVREATGLTCAWADYTGFHVGQVPDRAPPYSHLWGWSADRLLRARIDGDGAVVGLLLPVGTPLPDGARLSAADVAVQVTTCRPWGSDDTTVGDQPDGVLDGTWEVLEVRWLGGAQAAGVDAPVPLDVSAPLQFVRPGA